MPSVANRRSLVASLCRCAVVVNTVVVVIASHLRDLWLLVVVSSVHLRYLVVNTVVVVVTSPLRPCVSLRFALVVISRRPSPPEH